MDLLLPLAIAGVFALTHILGPHLVFLSETPRSVWLSAAGGVSVAYVFVHLLPELAEHQKAIGQAAEKANILGSLESHAYILALIGLGTFYGLDRLARGSALEQRRKSGEPRPSKTVFWIHLGAFAAYNLLIGYLLLHREEQDLRGLIIYAVAMALHFIVNDQGLRQQHGRIYDRSGRWLLAITPVAGLGLGLAITVSPAMLAGLFAFLGGGIILNVLKEELPEDRESRFSAFALGSALYALLLLATG